MTIFRLAVVLIALAAAVPAAHAKAKDSVALNSAVVRTTVCTDKFPDLAADLQAALRDYEARASYKMTQLVRNVNILAARGRLGGDIDGLLRVRPGTTETSRVLCEKLPGELRGGNPAEDSKALEAWAPIREKEERKALLDKLRLSSPKQFAALERLADEGLEVRYSRSPMLIDLMITEVKPGSRAEKAGLLKGDVIIALNGQPVRTYIDLADALIRAPRNRVLDLAVDRPPAR